MIRPVGRLGAVKVAGLVLWQLRYDLLAILIVAGLLVPVPDAFQIQYAAAVLSVLGIAAAVFIGFRNTTAYNRWWEARTLWGGQIISSRVLHNGLTAVDNGSPAMAAILDRMRRRQVRYCWQLAAEMRGIEPLPGVIELTAEDSPDTDSTELLNLQAADVQTLAADGHIDQQARVMLMAANTGSATAQSGLERIRNEPFPIHYDFFIRMLAWFFGIMAFSRLDSSGHDVAGIAVGLLLMTVFIIAERLGRFIEEPMNNSIFDIPMYRLCGIITGNLLGRGHPLARPQDSETAAVWM
ncbi:MAG: bestrophin family ion channel [Mycobacterium sp.]